MNVVATLKQPSAFVPLAMSAAAFATVVVHVSIFGVVHEADEGTAAHIFQLLLALQLPIVAFFALTRLPRIPREAAVVLTLQACAGLVALAPVYFLHL